MNRLSACLLVLAVAGCVRAPEIVLVDRATALEQQAGGSFEDVENELARKAIAPSPEALTPDQLETLGIKPAPLVDRVEPTDADRLDALLRQRCVGEGKDGLLVDTFADCLGASDHAAALTLLDRNNRARFQLFRWLHAQRPELSADTLQKEWREKHVRGVVCHGWLQGADGSWAPKSC